MEGLLADGRAERAIPRMDSGLVGDAFLQTGKGSRAGLATPGCLIHAI